MNTPKTSRRTFLTTCSQAAAVGLASSALLARASSPSYPATRCVTMWDFSWLERRWSGAGFEDWPRVLAEAKERGYDTIRFDPYPHLYAAGAERQWELRPVWTVQDWGSPGVLNISIRKPLLEFMTLCREHGFAVALSSWFREDASAARMQLKTPEAFARAWLVLLHDLKKEGLLDGVIYVDLCNEWPGDLWCPYFENEPPTPTFGAWHTERSRAWMKEAAELVRREFPDLPLGFSYTVPEPTKLLKHDLSYLDFADPHLWMTQANDGEFYKKIDYHYERFDLKGYNNLVARGEALYRANPAHWQAALTNLIHSVADAYRPTKTPLFTTECWAVVDYKDWPMLDWGWVRELCELGVKEALSTGQWCGVSTSNFAGPQFNGMWREKAWHQRINAEIARTRPVALETQSKMLQRLAKFSPL